MGRPARFVGIFEGTGPGAVIGNIAASCADFLLKKVAYTLRQHPGAVPSALRDASEVPAVFAPSAPWHQPSFAFDFLAFRARFPSARLLSCSAMNFSRLVVSRFKTRGHCS